MSDIFGNLFFCTFCFAFCEFLVSSSPVFSPCLFFFLVSSRLVSSHRSTAKRQSKRWPLSYALNHPWCSMLCLLGLCWFDRSFFFSTRTVSTSVYFRFTARKNSSIILHWIIEISLEQWWIEVKSNNINNGISNSHFVPHSRKIQDLSLSNHSLLYPLWGQGEPLIVILPVLVLLHLLHDFQQQTGPLAAPVSMSSASADSGMIVQMQQQQQQFSKISDSSAYLFCIGKLFSIDDARSAISASTVTLLFIFVICSKQ